MPRSTASQPDPNSTHRRPSQLVSPAGSTDERVHAYLTTEGPASAIQLSDALHLGYVSATMSLDRLRLAGVARVGTVRGANVEIWEAFPDTSA